MAEERKAATDKQTDFLKQLCGDLQVRGLKPRADQTAAKMKDELTSYEASALIDLCLAELKYARAFRTMEEAV